MKQNIIEEIKKPKRLAYFLFSSVDEIERILNHIDRYYYLDKRAKTDEHGEVRRKHGEIEYRTLYPSTGRLKNIQDLIKKRILDEIDLPDCVSCTAGKGHVRGAAKHKGKKYHFITDIKNFFPSITNEMVYRAFCKYFPADVSKMLTELTTYKGSVPQGTPTSTHIANLVPLEIDKSLKQMCEQHDIIYTRYVDDLSFSSQTDFQPETHELIKLIQDHGFHVNQSKTYYKIGPTLVTGIWVKNNELDVRDDQKERLNDPEVKTASKVGTEEYLRQVQSQ